MGRPKAVQPKTVKWHIALSLEEKAALEVMAAARGLKAAIHVLQEMGVKEAVTEARRIRKALSDEQVT